MASETDTLINFEELIIPPLDDRFGRRWLMWIVKARFGRLAAEEIGFLQS